VGCLGNEEAHALEDLMLPGSVPLAEPVLQHDRSTPDPVEEEDDDVEAEAEAEAEGSLVAETEAEAVMGPTDAAGDCMPANGPSRPGSEAHGSGLQRTWLPGEGCRCEVDGAEVRLWVGGGGGGNRTCACAHARVWLAPGSGLGLLTVCPLWMAHSRCISRKMAGASPANGPSPSLSWTVRTWADRRMESTPAPPRTAAPWSAA
jgi:hypothetical protein